MVVGEELFADLPDLELNESEQGKLMECSKASLRLYAMHQQSKQKPMAVAPAGGNSRKGSFGRSCRAITGADSEKNGADGVRRRMALVEAASNIQGIEFYMRQLVLQMRAKDVTLDYGKLAHDLYLLQFDWARDGVFMGWARDYYAPKKEAESSASPKSDKAACENESV
jgi:CRISPR system Cascade subunit CasB